MAEAVTRFPEASAPPRETSRAAQREELNRRIERLLPGLRHAVRRHLQYHEATGELRPREAEPDDLVIETIARVLRDPAWPASSRRLYPRMLRIAFHVVEEEVRRRRKEHAHVVRSLEDPVVSHAAEHAFEEPVQRLLDLLPAPGPLPEEVVERQEFQRYLESQLNRLPREPALALLYHDVERMSYRDVAELFQVSDAQARRWVRLARDRLAEALSRDGWVELPPAERLFRPGKAPSAQSCREWLMRATDRAIELGRLDERGSA